MLCLQILSHEDLKAHNCFIIVVVVELYPRVTAADGIEQGRLNKARMSRAVYCVGFNSAN